MTTTLRIGEYRSLATLPYFFPLRHLFREPNWVFLQTAPHELEAALDKGELDLALVSPSALIQNPLDYLIFPDLGLAARGHVRDILFFSDMLLEDLDEMTVSVENGFSIAQNIVRLVLGRYLQYQNQFISGWGNAEAYVLTGDAALRERILARYAYVYDLGDLWRHYTGKAMIYYLWVVRKDALREKKALLSLFYRRLKQALEYSLADWSRLAGMVQGYEWLKRTMIVQLWTQLEYQLQPPHFEGLLRYYEDCAEFSLLDEPPDLEYFEPD